MEVNDAPVNTCKKTASGVKSECKSCEAPEMSKLKV